MKRNRKTSSRDSNRLEEMSITLASAETRKQRKGGGGDALER